MGAAAALYNDESGDETTESKEVGPPTRFGPPSPPRGPLKVTTIIGKGQMLAWRRPKHTNGCELTHHIVERRVNESDIWIQEAQVEEGTRYTVKNLSAQHDYHFRIFAVNALGRSEPLETTAPHRLQFEISVPDQPSKPLEIRQVGKGMVRVSWGRPLLDGGSRVRNYVVALRDTERRMWIEVGQVKANRHEMFIKDLQEGHSYEVRVMAQNSIGMSRPLTNEAGPITLLTNFESIHQGDSDSDSDVDFDEDITFSCSTEHSSWARPERDS